MTGDSWGKPMECDATVDYTIVAAAVSAVLAAWAALAVTQHIYDSLRTISIDLVRAYKDSGLPDEIRDWSKIPEIIILRQKYWFLSVSLFFYFGFLGISVYMFMDLLDEPKLGRLFTIFMGVAAFCYAFIEIKAAKAMFDRKILRWSDLNLTVKKRNLD